MQRAGQAAARTALRLMRDASSSGKVLVLAGPGNNGGDALVASVYLAQSGMQVTVLFEADPNKLPLDAQAALRNAQNNAVHFMKFGYVHEASRTSWDLVIDGLFGIGLSKPVAGRYKESIEAINSFSCPILALDVPSGLNADTGDITGEGIAVEASHTVTFIGDKPGLHTGHGKDYAGIVEVAHLDIDEHFFSPACLHKNDPSLFSRFLGKRLHNSHKGSYGDVAVIGGAKGMQGAAILAARTALKSGAGRVLTGFLENPPPYDSMQPELMCRPAEELELQHCILVAGPGLGKSTTAVDMLCLAIASPSPLVLDADALNIIADDKALQERVFQRNAPTLITPHPLEAARLLSMDSKDIQSDRLSAAKELARRFNAVSVLKGSGTIVAHPEGARVLNTTGNPALATGGTGDVLAGLCGALLAQHIPAWESAMTAVWIHGMAADMLVDQGTGPIGLSAGELIPVIRSLLNRLIA